MRLVAALWICCLAHAPLVANDWARLEADLDAAPRAAALFLYPNPVPSAVLAAAAYPAVLAGTAALYRRLDSGIDSAASGLSPRDRAALSRLAQRPGLMERLSAGELPADLPDRLQSPARRLTQDHPDLLAQIHALQQQTQLEAARLVIDLPPAGRDAFAALSPFPKAIAAIDRHLGLFVLLGQAYAAAPDSVTGRLDAFALDFARRQVARPDADGRDAPSRRTYREEFRPTPYGPYYAPVLSRLYAPYPQDFPVHSFHARVPTYLSVAHPRYRLGYYRAPVYFIRPHYIPAYHFRRYLRYRGYR